MGLGPEGSAADGGAALGAGSGTLGRGQRGVGGEAEGTAGGSGPSPPAAQGPLSARGPFQRRGGGRRRAAAEGGAPLFTWSGCLTPTARGRDGRLFLSPDPSPPETGPPLAPDPDPRRTRGGVSGKGPALPNQSSLFPRVSDSRVGALGPPPTASPRPPPARPRLSTRPGSGPEHTNPRPGHGVARGRPWPRGVGPLPFKGTKEEVHEDPRGPHPCDPGGGRRGSSPSPLGLGRGHMGVLVEDPGL